MKRMTMAKQQKHNTADMRRHLPEQAEGLRAVPDVCEGTFGRPCGKPTTDRCYCDAHGDEFDGIVREFGDPLRAVREKYEAFETRTARIVSRYSFLDLREMSDEDLNRGVEMLLKSEPMEIVRSGISDNFIDWFHVESEGQEYIVRSFMSFGYCSCRDFYYRKSCKHYARTKSPSCKCGRSVEVYGETCEKCEMKTALYLKNTSDRVPEKLGGVRF